jgi:exportin-2 (importin alpha re-exporter)
LSSPANKFGIKQHWLVRAQLKQYFKPLVMTLLTKMQTSKTDKYTYLFSHFLLFTMVIDVDGLRPDYVMSAVEEIQPQ